MNGSYLIQSVYYYVKNAMPMWYVLEKQFPPKRKLADL